MDTLSQILTNNCKKIKEEKGWTSVSRIIGEAVEYSNTRVALF